MPECLGGGGRGGVAQGIPQPSFPARFGGAGKEKPRMKNTAAVAPLRFHCSDSYVKR